MRQGPTDPVFVPPDVEPQVEISFERLGWLRCSWSGFRLYLDWTLQPYGENNWYSENAVVLGFWVWQFRVWAIRK